MNREAVQHMTDECKGMFVILDEAKSTLTESAVLKNDDAVFAEGLIFALNEILAERDDDGKVVRKDLKRYKRYKRVNDGWGVLIDATETNNMKKFQVEFSKIIKDIDQGFNEQCVPPEFREQGTTRREVLLQAL